MDLLGHLFAALHHARPDGLDSGAFADAVWLAGQILRAKSAATAPGAQQRGAAERPKAPPAEAGEPAGSREDTGVIKGGPGSGLPSQEAGPPGMASLRMPDERANDARPTLDVRVPGAPSLPASLEIARALRPLRRRLPSPGGDVIAEAETAQQIADRGFWLPVLRPRTERWLDLALVFDDSPTMAPWRSVALDLERLLRASGAFRETHVYHLTSAGGQTQLFRGFPWRRASSQPLRPGVLVDPRGRRLILICTDAVSDGWYDGSVAELLLRWSSAGMISLLSPLPDTLWHRTALGSALHVPLRRPHVSPFAPVRLAIGGTLPLPQATLVPVPVVSLDPEPLRRWARFLGRSACTWPAGFLLDPRGVATPAAAAADGESSGEDRVDGFLQTSSPAACRLACLLAASPLISRPVSRLIRETMVPEASLAREAEVFLGEILEVIQGTPLVDPDEVLYEFYPGVRDLLLEAAPAGEAHRVLAEVSGYIERNFGKLRGFRALVLDPRGEPPEMDPDDTGFAEIGLDLLARFGGEYARAAERLREVVGKKTHVPRMITDQGYTTGDDSLPGATRSEAEPRLEQTTLQEPQLAAAPTVGTAPDDSPTYAGEFVGREQEVSAILAYVSRGQPVVIVGDFRMGKTSLLRHLASRLELESNTEKADRSAVVSCIDANIFGRLTLKSFWETVLEPCAGQLGDTKDIRIAHDNCREQGYSGLAVRRLVRTLGRAQRQLVVMVDEFGSLVYRHAAEHLEFFASLRALLSESDGALVFVVTSQRPLRSLDEVQFEHGYRGSPLFNLFVEVPLGPLNNEETDRILRGSRASLSSEDIEFAQLICGGLPYLVRTAASTLFRGHGLESDGGYHEVAAAVSRVASQTLASYWRDWPVATRRVFAGAALEHLDALGARVGWEPGIGTGVDRAAHHQEIHRLELSGLIAKRPGARGSYVLRPLAALAWFAAEMCVQARSSQDLARWLGDEGFLGPALYRAIGSCTPMLRTDLVTLVAAHRALSGEPSTPTRRPVRVYCSYAGADDGRVRRFMPYLAGLQREGLVKTWSTHAVDEEDRGGAVSAALADADVVLVFVSADLLASDWFYDIEMPYILERYERDGAVVVPIRLRPCDWGDLWLSKLAHLPEDGQAVAQWRDTDEAWAQVARGVQSAIAERARLAPGVVLFAWAHLSDIQYGHRGDQTLLLEALRRDLRR